MGVNMVSGNNNQQGNLASISLSGPAIIQFSQQNQSTTNLNGSQSVAILELGAEPEPGAGRDQSGRW